MKQDNLQPSISPTKRRWRWPLAAVVLASAAVGGWVVTHQPAPLPSANAHDKKDEKKDEKKEEKKDTIFELGVADSSEIEVRELALTLPVNGSIVPSSQATVKAKVPGSVQETMVQEGVAVKAGQVLARLDSADLQARVATQQAALDEAKARLSLAKKNNENNQALLKQNYISQNSYDTTQNNLELAQASVRSAQAQLEIAKIALADSVIRSPITGVVAKRFVQTGDKASPDMPMFAIVNLGEMTLEAMVPSSEIARVKIGQEVTFQVDGFANRQFHGKVGRINPNADAGSRSLMVYVQIENDGSLKGGMYAKGNIAIEKSSPMPLLPLYALRQDNGKNIVYKIANGQIMAQEVKLGLKNEEAGLVEVSAGLQKGDHVLMTQIEQLKPGSKVKLANKPAAAPASKA